MLLLFSLIFLSNNFILQTQAQYPPFIPRIVLPGDNHLQWFQSEPLHGRKYDIYPVGLNAFGPESTAFDCKGEGPYVGVSDGRILKWQGTSVGWIQFAITNPQRSDSCDGLNLNNEQDKLNCGRPLGLMFNMATCELYIADANLGLLKVGPNGGPATTLATSADGIPFHFINTLDIDTDTGDIYFTESSTNYQLWQHEQIIALHDQSGRLMKYSPETEQVTVLLTNLSFANGVALSKNKDFIIVAETTALRIIRYWLTGDKAGTTELFLQLSDLVDNIHRNADGDFWVAQLPSKPIKINEAGMILQTLDVSELTAKASDVNEFNNLLWIGSLIENFVACTTI